MEEIRVDKRGNKEDTINDGLNTKDPKVAKFLVI